MYFINHDLAAPAALSPASDPSAWMSLQFAELRRLEPKRPVLLLLDEAQTLGKGVAGDAAMKAVRGLFNAHPGGLLLLLTGSSKPQLLSLVGDHSKTAFKLAAHMDSPTLGIGFVSFVGQRHKASTGRKCSRAPDADVFEPQRLHHGRLVQIAPIDHHGLLEQRLDRVEVGVLESARQAPVTRPIDVIPKWDQNPLVRVIAKPKLIAFWQQHPSAKQALQTWYEDASRAQWASSQDIKRRYASASFMAGNRVVFNIKGNEFRLVVAVAYRFKALYIKFVGTHAQYDAIDAAAVEPRP